MTSRMELASKKIKIVYKEKEFGRTEYVKNGLEKFIDALAVK